MLMKKNIFLILAVVIFTAFSGCSGGGGSSSSSSSGGGTSTSNMNGFVQKGAFVDGTIQAQQVESNGTLVGTPVSARIGRNGEYGLNITWKGLTYVTAEGHFFNEYTGKITSDTITLNALIDFSQKSVANINLFTSLEASRILDLMQKGTSYSNALKETKDVMQQVFNLSKDVNATQLDIYDVNSSLKDENINLLLLSATFLKVIEEETASQTSSSSPSVALAPAKAPSKRLNRFQDFTQRFYHDFKKDGRIDGLFKDDWEKIIEDDENKTLDIVGKNVREKLKKDLGDLSEVGKVDIWANRLRLSISTPSYIFESGKLKEIDYDVSLPVTNFFGLNSSYTVDFNTSDVTAIAGQDYNATSGSFVFTLNDNTHTIKIPVLHQSQNDKNLTINFSTNNKKLSIPNAHFSVTIPKSSTYNEASNVDIAQLLLNRISVDGFTSNVGTSDSVVFIGSASSNASLRFLYRARSLVAYSYFVKVYALMEGETPLLVLDDTLVNTVGYVGFYWQVANLSVPVTQQLKSMFEKSNESAKPIRFKVVAKMNGNSTSEKTSANMPQFAQISKTMQPHTSILHAVYKAPRDNKCKVVQSSDVNFSEPKLYALMDIDGEYSAKGMSNSVPVRYTNVCVELDKDSAKNEFNVKLLQGHGVLFDVLKTTIGGIDIEMVPTGVTTSTIAIGSVVYTLPRDNSVHEKDTDGNISPRGVNRLTLSGAKNLGADTDLSTESYSGSFKNQFLHAKALPFYLSAQSFTLDPQNGLTFKNARPQYVFAYANKFRNNTALFSSPNGETTFDFSLDSNGIQAPKFAFKKTEFQSSFPKMQSVVNNFNVVVKNSVVQKTALSSEHNISYTQNCTADDCQNSTLVGKLTLTSSQSQLYKGGAVVATQEGALNQTVAWGSKDGKSVFSRESDSDARVFINGYLLPTNKAAKIGDFLLGSAKVNGDNLIYYDAASQNAKDGKYLFAGANIGNFADPENNSLNDTQMSVTLGANNSLNVISNKYSKYYVRRSGVTGVFNNKNKISDFYVYGYKMNFDSFKFRQRENLLDEYTKINGGVYVPNKGDFDVLFNNLQLTCRGNFSGGKISDEQGNVTLKAWKTNSILTTVDFKNSSSDMCSNTKVLSLGHVLKVAALKDELGLNTFWSNDGVPYDSEIISARSNQLDGNSSLDNTVDNGGYDVALNSIEFKSAGSSDWVESSASFGLPFWGVQSMSMRLQNKTTTTREPTVVAGSGDLYKDGRLETQTNADLAKKILDSYSYNIKKDWANVIHFTMPVYYNSVADKRPDFLGRKLNSDLIVLKTDSIVDYITPRRTSMSFGASANTAELHGLKLHVDLNDPNSLKEIDKSLKKYLGIENALQDTIGELVENINIGNKLLKNGLNLSMEEGAYLALKGATKIVGKENDPFENITQLNAQIHAVPATMQDRISEIFTQKIGGALHSDLNITEQRRMINDALDELDELIAYLNKVHTTLSSIPAVDINDVKNFIYEQGFGSSVNTCSYDNFTKKGFFKPIGKVNKSIADVNKKLQNIKIAKIRKLAKTASNYTGFDADDLVSTAQKIQGLSEDLNNLVNDMNSSLVSYFNQDFCSGLSTAFDNHGLLGTSITTMNTFKINVENNVSAVLATLQSPEVQDTIAQLRNLTDTNQSILSANIDNKIVTPLDIALNPLTTEINQNIPNIKADDMRRLVVSKIFELPPVRDLNAKITLKLQPVADEVNKLSMVVFSGFDRSINELLAKVNNKVNDVLNSATSKLDAIPLATGKMDGYAVFYGDTLAKMHVSSEFSVTGKDKDNSFGFNAALDIENDENNDSVGCPSTGGNFSNSNVHAQISTRDITMPLGEKKLSVDLLLLGVTINAGGEVKGIFGAINSKEGLQFDTFKLYNLGLATGIGSQETYLGAKANATMDSLQLGVSFLVGQVCNRFIVSKLIPPAIDEFITIPNNKFNGALVFGEGQMPIYTNGCVLTVIARAKLGTWFLFGPPKTYGGIVGGGAFGKGLCIATLGGEVEVLGEKSGDTVRFKGKGWGAAGVGSCDSSWSSVGDSRDDSWCGTGDAQFGAAYDNGWSLEKIRTSAVH